MRSLAQIRRRGKSVDATQDLFVGHAVRSGRLRVVLVMQRDVVEDVLWRGPVHPLDPVTHDGGQFVGKGRVVAADIGDGAGQDVAVAVIVLEALTGQRRPAGRRAHQETPTARIREGPHLVAGPLEPEHRIEDVERDHGQAMAGIGRPCCLERGHGAGLRDALLQDLSVGRLPIGQHKVGVHGLVALAVGGVDADLLEQRVQAEGARLIGDDGHDPSPEFLVPDQVAQDPREDHRGGDRGRASGLELRIDGRRRLRQPSGSDDAPGDGSTQRLAMLPQVLDLFRVRPWVVVRGVLELAVRDGQLKPVPEDPQFVLGQLLGLVGHIPSLDARSQGPALDGLGQDDRRGTLEFGRGLVGRIELAVVVAAATQLGQVVVGQVVHQLAQSRVRPEEVFAYVRTAGHGELLELAVQGVVHLLDQDAVHVTGQELVPFAGPDHLDDIPPGTPEDRLKLLDDLAVATDRPVQALQIAVDDEGQVVQTLACGHVQRAQRFRFVRLAVAKERPDPGPGRVQQATVLEVAVEPGLVDGADRTQPHGDARVLPELGHEPRVRVRTEAGVARDRLAPEMVELVFGQASFQKRPRVDARSRVALVEDLVATSLAVLAPEEVVEAGLVQARG